MDSDSEGQHSKRKAGPMESPDDVPRAAPVQPVQGHPTQQVNHHYQGSNSSSIVVPSPSKTDNNGHPGNQGGQNSMPNSNQHDTIYGGQVGGPVQQQHPVDSSLSTLNNADSSSFPTSSSSFTLASFMAMELHQQSPHDDPSPELSHPDALVGYHPNHDKKLIFFNYLLSNKDILYQICRWLPADNLISLYAVSKTFHGIIDKQLTALMMVNARTRMPETASIFRFKVYKTLTKLDTAPNPSKDKDHEIRDVPTFRWLKLLEFREATVKSILVELALKGQRLPRAASLVIKKIWFLMDIPDSRRRIGTIHNGEIWSDSDLFIACMFFMKLDMAVMDPINNDGSTKMRQLLLSQRSLSTIDRVLRRELMRNQHELLQMVMEWNLNLHAALNGVHQPIQIPATIFGVPTVDVNHLRGQNWNPRFGYLVPIDGLVMRESLKRGLRFKECLIDMMTWGNLNPVTGEDVWPRDWKGEVQVVFSDEVEDQAARDIEEHIGMRDDWVDWTKKYQEGWGDTTAATQGTDEGVAEGVAESSAQGAAHGNAQSSAQVPAPGPA